MEFFDVAIIGGGRSGLAAAHAVRQRGVRPVVLETASEVAGSWPRHYDSLTLFSRARYGSLPGVPFGGDPDRHPHRDEVIAHLLRHADQLDAEIRTGQRAGTVRCDGEGFALTLDGGGLPHPRTLLGSTRRRGRRRQLRWTGRDRTCSPRPRNNRRPGPGPLSQSATLRRS